MNSTSTSNPPAAQATPTGMTAPAPKAGQLVRQEFGAQELEASGETAGTVMAAQARAIVEARYVMALRKPRDWDDVRAKLLRACERPGFAGSATDKVWGAAWYRKPVGDGIEGFSIRFAEEALRCMSNVDVQSLTVYDDDAKRLVVLTVTDLESNIPITSTITIDKTVERSFLPRGEEALRVRTNKQGKTTYILRATDDEVFSKQQNLSSKVMRTNILRLLPGDIQAECRTRILAIRNGDIASDPDKVRRQVADGFAKLNVLPSHLKEYLGHELITSTPAELAELRDLWKALEEGRTTWPDVMASVREERGEEPAGGANTGGQPTRAGLDGVADELERRKAAAAAASAPPVPAAQPAATSSAPAPGCTHPQVPTNIPPGVTFACPACGEELSNDEPEASAPPPAAAPPAEAPATTGKKSPQRRLME